ncbi:chorismate-binding protein [Arthrobacter gandavensis]|uniref:chorismate-binding protein n=1 Tax=Arthrobacter gandavensis TaxID=169960 RepID=UPI00189043BE|nr:chorismate-binding protein [Arthrobacter gandavensis]MBF4994174.1 chorismate-binding protein [Arthrobacter gandavensis]
MTAAAGRPLLIGIDGFSGAGKTSLALELAAALRVHRSVAVFHLEDVYPGWDGLQRGMDYYRREVLAPLAVGREATWRAWDWDVGSYGRPRRTEPAEIIIFEGVGAAHRAARTLLDAVVWVQAPEELRKERALARDGETYAPHWDRWARQEAAWAAADPAAADAGVILSSGPSHFPLYRYALRALQSLPLPAPGLGLTARPGPSVSVHTLPGAPDPQALFGTLFGNSPNAVWLDSSDAGTAGAGGSPPERSRFSIMADDGGALGRHAVHASGTTRVAWGPVTMNIPGPFFRWLDSEWGRTPVSVPATYPCPFALGWMGALGYGLKRETGAAAAAARRAGQEPGTDADAALIFAARAVVLDHARAEVHVLLLHDPDLDDPAAAAGPEHQAAVIPEPGTPEARWLRTALDAVDGARNPAGTPSRTERTDSPVFSFRDSRAGYLAKVLLAQDEIRDGNSYEICLTTALEATLPGSLSPRQELELYGVMRRRSPAPFASLLRIGGLALLGTSPERFLRISAGGNLRAEPIKGTRPRGTAPAEDDALRRDLLESTKDRAENIMIVDLMRNDLSRLAVPGTVAVPRLCVVESYATVHQLVSTIDARLAPGASWAEAVAAAFPAGSMTGAPKVSTMEILDRLESGPRGFYSGVLGYFSLTGAADLSVVIRTLELRPDGAGGTSVRLGVGGAVTSGSDPAAEWEEVRTKSRGVLGALGSEVPAG